MLQQTIRLYSPRSRLPAVQTGDHPLTTCSTDGVGAPSRVHCGWSGGTDAGPPGLNVGPADGWRRTCPDTVARRSYPTTPSPPSPRRGPAPATAASRPARAGPSLAPDSVL